MKEHYCVHPQRPSNFPSRAWCLAPIHVLGPARLRHMEGPVVVVAHSYGGLPVTEVVGDHPNVARLVYLAAYMPTEGESASSIHGIPVPEDVSGVAPLFADPRAMFYGDLSDADAERAIGQLVPQSLRSLTQKTTRSAWRTVPSTYVVCEQDQVFPVTLQEKYAAQATNAQRLPTSHSPFLSAPGRLAALLARVAAESRP
ncbi:alpha/beta hydrolase [Streptomyces mirabilis]|uniref:alpha/beta fold hydrolase n=1 Tax=Streptomyces mirabilis TaxID=68239 RepID=UPI00331CA7F8